MLFRCGGRKPDMHVVIFEGRPKPGRKGDYLDIAAALRPELEQIDGFISIERFASLTDAGKVLSLSFWRDEAAVVRGRQHAEHQPAQRRGRHDISGDYSIRVAEVVRDYGLNDRARQSAVVRTRVTVCGDLGGLRRNKKKK